MMNYKTYVLNISPLPNGDHEIHKLHECDNLPNPESRITIGMFNSCREAIEITRAKFPGLNLSACMHCSPEWYGQDEDEKRA